ncbi:hypothetical protein [Rhodococcus erythropolis]|uniref:hypothetical protein n=1 Tax=Rhodococcus erythropolis TaxID=1833 RepID=UPI001BE5728F|nr:hypothetical protein [Rhodococcus erythropolis]MBT2268961.1 hypothetical protein [Rhodococcus erythropolis]
MNRFRFVADHSDAYPVKRYARFIDIAHSSYYAWVNGVPMRAARAAADVELAQQIRDIHTVDNTYGRPADHRRDQSRTTRRPTDLSQTDRTDHAR